MRLASCPYGLVGVLLLSACNSVPTVAINSDAGDGGEEGSTGPDATTRDGAQPGDDAAADVVLTFDNGPCSDGVKDGTETDVDCGGMSCQPCDTGGHCNASTDCQSAVCATGTCAAPSCSDGVSNGTETGVDCGGGVCPACMSGQACRFPTDCTSGVCQGGTLCVDATCSDGIKDGTETDTDCGGSGCAPCTNGHACAQASDCTSMKCIDSVCGQCASAADCPATGSECVTATCSANACGTTNVASSHVLSTQTAGDCQQVVCNGMGGTTSKADPTDLPVTASVCETAPACTGSPLAPSFTPAPTGTDCTADDKPPSHVCGDTTVPAIAGTCVACNVAADCPATGNACTAPGCVNNQCVPQNLGNSIAPPGLQTPGDCQKIVCNGAGGVTSVDDATDLPTSNTVCETNPACTGAPLAPSFTPAPTGTDCTADNAPPNHVCGDITTAAAGECVQCNVTADCATGSCTTHVCQ